MQVLWSVFSVLFVFGLVVCFHELGHFLLAKWSGIGVEIFSFGMGPRAFGKKIGETDYRVSWFPLGGYVKMQGDEETEGGGMAAAQGGADRPDPNRPGRDPARDYERHPKWQRLGVMAAGAVFNLILAVLLFSALNLGLRPEGVDDAPVVVIGFGENSPARAAGMRKFDRIVRINGAPVDRITRALIEIAISTKGPVTVTVLRGGAEREFSFAPEIVREKGEPRGRIGAYLGNAFAAPADGTPAARAGVRRGDIAISVNGVEYGDGKAKDAPEPPADQKSLEITVWRGGRVLPLTLTRSGSEAWGLQLREIHRRGPAAALRAGLADLRENAFVLYRFVGKLFSGESSLGGVGGPLSLMRLIGGTEYRGFLPSLAELLHLAAFISVQLGIINLLPIPALDGGHILILLLEGLTRREFSRKAKERIIAAGFFLLLGLVAILVVSDVAKLFHK